MKNTNLTKGNDSITTESKISKKSPTNKGSKQRLATPKMTQAATFLQKKVDVSMMIMSQTIYQTI